MSQSLGDRIKSYEAAQTASRFLPMVPIVARMDGKKFSKLTKKMNKPWDPTFTECMIDTTSKLVKETNARVGYTQSDEISLIFLVENPKSEIWLAGKAMKMTSILASMTTAFFNEAISNSRLAKHVSRMNGQQPAFFDARVFQVPNKQEAVNCLVWRESDAVRNSISMLAHHHFSNKQLFSKNISQMQDMLMKEKGINWNDTSPVWKRGTYLQRKTTTEPMTDDILANIPKHLHHTLPKEVTRSRVVRLELPRLTQIENRVEVIFDGAEPLEYVPFP
tara:strand:+ start:2805 stop:3635 length:831 start_codon:yes stop_codon:yes gene_type:complete